MDRELDERISGTCHIDSTDPLVATSSMGDSPEDGAVISGVASVPGGVSDTTVSNTNDVSKDMVNNPPHYTALKTGGFPLEAIDVTQHFNFCRGNVIKYVWRAGRKGPALEDLKKARWYLDKEIESLES